MIHIRVVEAQGLPKMDVIGSVDPYCAVSISSLPHPKQTKVIKKNKNPVWNEEFHFPVHDITDTIQFVLIDHDTVSNDDPISKISIPVKTFTKSTVVDKWYDMVPFKRVKKGGKLRLVIHYGESNEKPFNPLQTVSMPNNPQNDRSRASSLYVQPNQQNMMMQPMQQQQHYRASTMLPQQYPGSLPQQYPNSMMMVQPYPGAMMMPQQNYQPNLMMQQMQGQQYQSAPMMQPSMQPGVQQIPAQQYQSAPMMQPGMQQNPQQMQPQMMMQQPMYPQNMMMMQQPMYQQNMMMMQQMPQQMPQPMVMPPAGQQNIETNK